MAPSTSYTAERMDDLVDALHADESVPTAMRGILCELARNVSSAAIQRHELFELQRETLSAVKDLSPRIAALEKEVAALSTGRVATLEQQVRDLLTAQAVARGQFRLACWIGGGVPTVATVAVVLAKLAPALAKLN